MMPRLKEKYLKEVVPNMMKEFAYKNIMEVPKVQKVVFNVGLGEAIQNIKLLDAAQKELSTIYRAESSCDKGEEINCFF